VAWRQLIVRIAAPDLAETEALLRLAGALALSINDAGDHPLLEPGPGETPLWPSLELRALFPETIDLRQLGNLLSSSVRVERPPDVAELAEADWIAAWRQEVRARQFATGLWVVPAHAARPAGATHVVRLSMGLAFGTGRHATTSLCLDRLTPRLAAGASVLDFGCGSGILALAALELGAERAWAADNDPQALTATRANADLNGFRARLWIGSPDELPPIAADVVVANIVAGTLLECANRLAALAKPGATLVLSGILNDQRQVVERGFAAAFEDFAATDQDGWMCLTARRKHRALG
jgi:ribosomal protein L11 methyltransferase